MQKKNRSFKAKSYAKKGKSGDEKEKADAKKE